MQIIWLSAYGSLRVHLNSNLSHFYLLFLKFHSYAANINRYPFIPSTKANTFVLFVFYLTWHSISQKIIEFPSSYTLHTHRNHPHPCSNLQILHIWVLWDQGLQLFKELFEIVLISKINQNDVLIWGKNEFKHEYNTISGLNFIWGN